MIPVLILNGLDKKLQMRIVLVCQNFFFSKGGSRNFEVKIKTE